MERVQRANAKGRTVTPGEIAAPHKGQIREAGLAPYTSTAIAIKARYRILGFTDGCFSPENVLEHCVGKFSAIQGAYPYRRASGHPVPRLGRIPVNQVK